MVKATVKSRPGEERRRSEAYCGKCGQALWLIDHLRRGEAALSDSVANGYTPDATRTWRPTDTYRAQWRAAHDRVSAGRARPDDRDVVHSAHNGTHGRHGRNVRLNSEWSQSPERIAALRLPASVECIQCREVNEVAIG